MTDAYWLRSANGHPRYVAIGGRAGRLYSDLDYLMGARGRLERQALRLAEPLLRSSADLPLEALEAVDAVSRSVDGLHQALLLWTGYYKQTWLVGSVVDTGGRRSFCKVFKVASETAEELHRRDELAKVLPASMKLPRGRSGTEGVVLYELVQRPSRRRRPSLQELADLSLQLGATALRSPENSDHLSAPSAGSATAEALCARYGCATGEALMGSRSFHPSVLVVAHGDFTPWNMICAVGGELYAVDFEAVGLWPPYYDFVHLWSQVATLAGKELDVAALVRRLGQSGVDGPANVVRRALAFDVIETAQAFLAYQENRHRTGRALDRKVSAWTRV